MIRSINTVNKNMNILQKRLENSNANIANVNTPGYKFQDLIWAVKESHEMFNYSGGINGGNRVELGNFIYSNELDEVKTNFAQGMLYETNLETDYAIIGNGFFTIRMNDGELAYTRNGKFILNDENQLTTLEGYLVVGEYNDSVSNLDLVVTDFDNYEDLISIGGTLFSSNIDGYTLENPEVKKGFLELSNTSVVDEIVKLIEISREFESNQKLLHAADETLSKTVNEIGRV